jgi:hypothetical protein
MLASPAPKGAKRRPRRVNLESDEPRRLPYAGINRIRFEGVISGRNGHP